ncbi:MAG: AAA family ATPase [Theionarchaea archaeon]|nr:AAA family ATPase [Theionarchaea archaeon]
MYMRKVRIKDFRSIIDSGVITFDENLIVMIGKNEQGKTNFLKALESFGKGYSYKEDDFCYLNRDSSSRTAFSDNTHFFFIYGIEGAGRK